MNHQNALIFNQPELKIASSSNQQVWFAKNGSPKNGSPNTLQKASKRKNTVAYNFAAYSYL